jgi:hypothetical protein
MAVKPLLFYPEMPTTFWSMCSALSFLGRKATLLPLGLLTVAAEVIALAVPCITLTQRLLKASRPRPAAPVRP